MMEDAMDDPVVCATNVDAVVVPTSHDLSIVSSATVSDIAKGALYLRYNPFEDLASDFARWLVQDVGEVVFRQHAVSRVC